MRIERALVALIAVSGLAACTPAARPMTAVRLVDGEPVVLLAGCADFQIDSVSVYAASGNSASAAPGHDRDIERTGDVVPESMPLFGDPPAGWRVTDKRLTALAPGQRYHLSAWGGTRKTVVITFADSDLAALGPDEVLVGKTPSTHKKTTEKKFREHAEDDC